MTRALGLFSSSFRLGLLHLTTGCFESLLFVRRHHPSELSVDYELRMRDFFAVLLLQCAFNYSPST